MFPGLWTHQERSCEKHHSVPLKPLCLPSWFEFCWVTSSGIAHQVKGFLKPISHPIKAVSEFSSLPEQSVRQQGYGSWIFLCLIFFRETSDCFLFKLCVDLEIFEKLTLCYIFSISSVSVGMAPLLPGTHQVLREVICRQQGHFPRCIRFFWKEMEAAKVSTILQLDQQV